MEQSEYPCACSPLTQENNLELQYLVLEKHQQGARWEEQQVAATQQWETAGRLSVGLVVRHDFLKGTLYLTKSTTYSSSGQE